MTQPTPDLISWPTFLQMTPAEIEAAFGSDAASRATTEIVKDVRLLTERTEEKEKKAS